MFNKVYYISGITRAGETINSIAFIAKKGSAAREKFYRAIPGSKIEMVDKRRHEKIILFFKWTLLILGVLLLTAVAALLFYFQITTGQNQ